MAVTPEFISDVSEALDELGYSVENEQDVIDDVSQLNDDVTLPGIRVQGGRMLGYVSMKLAIIYTYLQGRFSAIQSIWDTWFGTSVSSEGSVQKDWSDLRADVLTKTSDAEAAAQNANTKAALANSKAALADSKATLADTMATEASRVNASLSGMTVTVTNRNGVSSSVNIGFEIAPENVYASKAAMIADASHILAGKFCMIATTDPTSPDNATLWSRNSQPASAGAAAFTFLSDLDQASSAAWADWLDNMKPSIEAAITTAGNDHTTASADHTTAQSDHTTAQADNTTASSDHIRAGKDHNAASTDHTTATSDHTQASIDHSNAQADHTQAGTDHTTASNDHTTASNDHTTAVNDHSIAAADHTAASADHTQAGTDHTASATATTAANTQANRAKAWADHPPYIGDGTTGDENYWYIWNETPAGYVKSVYAKGDDLHWEEMSEADKADLVQRVLSAIAFDEEPTQGSSNAVKSGGIYTALQGKQDTLTFASTITTALIITELT